MATAPRRIYLDQMVDVEVAVRLEADGHDVLRAYLANMGEASDSEQLEFATEHNRILYTQNIRDFAPLAIQWGKEGKEHAGLLYSNEVKPGVIYQWITAALELDPGMGNKTLYLPVAD